MIRFIVRTVTSKRDVNGNCYHYAIVVSVGTGKSIQFQTGGDRNGVLLVKKLFNLDWSEVYESSETIGKREWQRYSGPNEIHEHEVTKEVLLKLEQ